MEAPGAADLKAEGRAWVRRLPAPAGLSSTGFITLKCRPLTGLFARLRGAAGRTRFDRHWSGAAWLREVGVPTPPPLALGTAHDGAGAVELLALEHWPGTTALAALAEGRGGPRGLRDLGDAMGVLAAKMTAAGRFNRDHKPSNLLVLDTPTPVVAVLDCVGLRPAAARDVWRGADRMLASMLIEPLGCGLSVPPALRLATLRGYLREVWRGDSPTADDELHGVSRLQWMRQSRAQLWARVERLIREHGDMTPSVNPLG